ncbi:MAG: tRNA 2-thiouridine(34) synthase MnmA [Planctomycetes bacterium]|nr:tRNA 2-thiouridine(34) synthase MnmA [Planctomycetota bacterium]
MARTKAVVAMSGGVDSSVAACLLHEQGYEIVGLFMRVGITSPETAATPAPAAGGDTQPASRPHQGCCSAVDAADARFVAGMLDVPFYALNFKEDFERIVDYFADEYARGRTPNPCVVCNHELKFGKLLDYADAVGADLIATGHYARIDTSGRRPRLRKGLDTRKDQSYVLFGLQREVLDRVLLPVGHLTKPEVRRAAARFGLPVCDKPDSVDICFVPDRDYARLVRERRPEAFVPGDVVDDRGRVLGRHEGVANFTIGQRRGLGIAAGHPLYVTRLNVLDNTIGVGDRGALLARRFRVSRVNLLVDPPAPPGPPGFAAHVKMRYQHPAAPAVVELYDDGTAQISFDEPQSAITPGQAAVFYDGDVVLGGGWIEQVFDDV